MQRTHDSPGSVTRLVAKASAAKGQGLGFTHFEALHGDCHEILHVIDTVNSHRVKKHRANFKCRRMK